MYSDNSPDHSLRMQSLKIVSQIADGDLTPRHKKNCSTICRTVFVDTVKKLCKSAMVIQRELKYNRIHKAEEGQRDY